MCVCGEQKCMRIYVSSWNILWGYSGWMLLLLYSWSLPSLYFLLFSFLLLLLLVVPFVHSSRALARARTHIFPLALNCKFCAIFHFDGILPLAIQSKRRTFALRVIHFAIHFRYFFFFEFFSHVKYGFEQVNNIIFNIILSFITVQFVASYRFKQCWCGSFFFFSLSLFLSLFKFACVPTCVSLRFIYWCCCSKWWYRIASVLLLMLVVRLLLLLVFLSAVLGVIIKIGIRADHLSSTFIYVEKGNNKHNFYARANWSVSMVFFFSFILFLSLFHVCGFLFSSSPVVFF